MSVHFEGVGLPGVWLSSHTIRTNEVEGLVEGLVDHTKVELFTVLQVQQILLIDECVLQLAL